MFNYLLLNVYTSRLKYHKMKQILTASIDEELFEKIRNHVRDSSFRNKSHFIEEAIKKFLEK